MSLLWIPTGSRVPMLGGECAERLGENNQQDARHEQAADNPIRSDSPILLRRKLLPIPLKFRLSADVCYFILSLETV